MKPAKKISCCMLALFFYCNAFSQNANDSLLKKYFFVMLENGPHRDQDSVTREKIQEGHLANIHRLFDEGKLDVAGPFLDDGEWLGIFIFDCKTKEEVEQFLQTDPAIQAGRLTYEIHPWMTYKGTTFK